MIIEAGFGLCASNLPTLYGMVKTKGVQTLINSVQSLFSLRSLSPHHSKDSARPRQRIGSQDSDSRIIANPTAPNENLTKVEHIPMQEDIGIRMTKDIEVSSSMV